MRLNMTTQGGLADEFMSGGGSVINPLILAGNPIQPQEAATKQYVDNSLLTLNASNLISGTIPGSRFPAMNGDFTSSPGSVALTLTNTGVVAGSYAKVSVDNKGRVTNGLPLIESDIPNFSWNKVNADRPTTLSGYGITDALGVSGGTLTGSISVNGTVTGSTQLVNKSYLDSVLGASTGIAVGDIIAKIDNTTPDGFLKCNGAELDKTTYASLYAAIGDTYTLNGKAGNGKPWQNQYDINTENFGEISTVTTIQSLPGVLGGGATFVTKNRVYVFGGFNGSSHVGTGYMAAINTDGTLGPWQTVTALPGTYAYSTAVVVKNKVYLLGGYINNTTATANIYVADINADGTIGAWGNGPAMPTATAYSHAFINNNRLYVVGGYNGSALNGLWSVNIKEDGSLGTWVTEANLPVSYYSGSVVTIKNRVFLVGGYQNTAASSTIWSAALNSDGSIGTWSFYSSLPVTAGLSQVVVTRNVIYLIGGTMNNSHSSSIYRAPINSDGSIGSWQLQGWTLPAVYNYGNVTVIKGHVYFIGGMGAGSAWNGTVFMGNITGGLNDYSAFYSMSEEQNFMVAGSGKPWQQQYQINTTQTGDITGWITDSSALPVGLSNSNIVVTKNNVYLIGGQLTAGTIVNTVYNAPINSDGTLGAWVTGTNFPVNIYLSHTAVIGNKVYVLGGCTNGTSGTSNVYMANINADGTIGTWTQVLSLASVAYQSQVIVTRNKIYLLGGRLNDTTYTSIVQYASVYPDGTIGSWSTGTALPVSLGVSQVAVTKNRVYLLGGYTGVGTLTANIYTATVNSDGSLGSWSTSGTLPTTLGGSQVVVMKNTIYLLGGGASSGVPNSNVYRASVNSDGVIGTWVASTSLPGNVYASQVIVTNNRLYLVGGHNGSASISSIYSAPILEGSNDYSSYYAEDNVNYCYPGSGKPWQQQYQFNLTQTADITGWSTGTALPVGTGYSAAFVTKNYAYYIEGAQLTNVIWRAPINGDGSLGTWTSMTSVLPVATGAGQAIVTKNRVYFIGGYVAGGSSVTSVYTSVINSDGTIGVWTTAGSLPIGTSYSTCFMTKSRIYLVGGVNGTNTYVSTVQSAQINADGTLGGWGTVTAFPITIGNAQAVVTKNRVYIVGGNSGTTFYNTIYSAGITPDGQIGGWVSAGTIPTAVACSQAIVVKNKIYLLAGYVGNTSITNAVWVATINADGTLGTWSSGTALPGNLGYSQAIVTNSRIYLLGGLVATNTVGSVVYTASFTGGLNDYSTYYDGSISTIEQFVTVAKFKIPDSTFVNDGLNYFIKI